MQKCVFLLLPVRLWFSVNRRLGSFYVLKKKAKVLFCSLSPDFKPGLPW